MFCLFVLHFEFPCFMPLINAWNLNNVLHSSGFGSWGGFGYIWS